MKPSSTRERIMLICLPAVMIVAVYGWLIYPRQQLQQAAESLRVARAREPSLVAFAEKQVEIRKLDEQLADADAEQARLQVRRGSALNPRVDGADGRLTAIRDLALLMKSYDLHLLDQGPADSKAATLPETLQQAAAKIAEKDAAKSEAVMWRLQFHGRYPDVLKVVKHLADSDHPAIPVQLLMDEVLANTDWRAWTLVVWI